MSYVEGRIAARRDWAKGLMTLTVDASIEPFKPGQFVNIGLRIGQESLFRAYSLASAPDAPLEFFLSEVQDGSFSPALFQSRVGDAVLLDPKPHGFFTLEWLPSAEELWLVATGTGLGPFISMLRSREPFDRFAHVVLVHGVRRAEQLAYADELDELALAQGGRLTRVPIVSRGGGDVEAAMSGRVTTTLVDGRLEHAAGRKLSPERSHVMLCGNPAMVEEMLELLAARGLRKHRTRKPGHVTIEKYWE
jgi:ferredoxin/flavodoxin---NADP+ reductase